MIQAISLTRLTTRLLFLVPFAALVLNASAASAQSPLGSAQSFAVLGASTVTNTGTTPPTMITGNVGVSPGTAITGFPPGVVLGGAIHAGDPVAARAHADALLAYVRLAGFDCPSINHLSGVLGTGGLHPTLPTGVYCFDTSAQLTGTLTLTGAGPWIFQVGTTLTTASDSQIIVVDAAPNCSGSNVFWQLGTSATLGTATEFAGNILALVSITATTGVNVAGSLIALGGAVTLDTNTVSVCSSGSGPFPPAMDKCEDHHDNDGDDHDKDGHHHDKDKDHKDNDSKDKDHDSKDKKRG
jgi:hypothetical protein